MRLVQAPIFYCDHDLALNTGIRKGSPYGMTGDMVDWKGRMLNIPRTKNEEPIHVSPK